MGACLLSLLVLAPAWAGAQEAPAPRLPWTQLSHATCRVDAFREAHPERDGRGVVLAILDTGVDMGVAGLRSLPGGGPKVVDVQDFSGQGDVDLRGVRRDPRSGELLDVGDDGYVARLKPPGELPADARFWLGTVYEDAFAELADLNGNGHEDDRFAVLVVEPPRAQDEDAIAVERAGAARLSLYPGVPCPLRFTILGAPPELAAGRTHVGSLRLHEVERGELVLEVPIER